MVILKRTRLSIQSMHRHQVCSSLFLHNIYLITRFTIDATYASYNSIYNFAMDLEEVSGQHVRTTHDAYETSDAPPPIPSKSYFGTRRKADVPTKVNTPPTYENW